MPLGRCILKSNVSPFPTYTYYPISAVVKLEGNKKPDTFDASFPMTNIVKENYEISYTQDIIDTTYLRAVYPMQLSCFDESGFDNDPASDPTNSRFVKVTSGRFKGHYALDFNADGQGVAIVDPRVANGGSIDISKQFDIHIKFTPDTTQLQDGSDEPILWSFRDSSDPRGLEIGITGTNGVDSSWKVFIRESNGSITNGLTGSDTGLIMTGAPVHIRVKRGQDNLLKAYVNGVEQISETKTADYQPTVATNMIFGDTPSSTSDEFIGQIHEVRIYCGTDLDDDQADRIRWSKPIPQFMKFAGRIVKLTSNQTTNRAICQSNSFRFTKGKLGGDGSSLTSTALSTDFDTLLQQAVDEIDSTFEVRHIDSFAAVTEVFSLTGNITEIGNFIQYASILLLYSDCIMYMTPRKKIIVESNTGHSTDYVFDQNGSPIAYHIKNSETNDVKLVNEVILTGTSPATAQRSAVTPTSGIIRTLRRNVLPINVSNNLNELAVKIRLDLQGDIIKDLAPTKYVVQTSSPIHHVRYNHVVNIKRKNGYNDSITFSPPVSDTDLDENLVVKQIEYHYPAGNMVINVGENDIDYFDDIVVSSRTQDGLVDTTL